MALRGVKGCSIVGGNLEPMCRKDTSVFSRFIGKLLISIGDKTRQ